MFELTSRPWTGYVFHWHHHFDGFFSSNSFIYQIHTKLSSNHRIHRRFELHYVAISQNFHMGKIQRRCRNPFTFFTIWKLTGDTKQLCSWNFFLWYLKVLQSKFFHIFTIFDQKSQILVIFERNCVCVQISDFLCGNRVTSFCQNYLYYKVAFLI